MGKTEDKDRKKMFLVLSLISNLGILFAFKYFNFFNDSFTKLFNLFNINYHIPSFNALLPVGISFYTFQTLSYSFDVYRGIKKPEKHLGIFAVYVSFFPQLVAGPIERSERLLPQFYQKHTFDYSRVTDGLKLMIWGFFKKLVIADRLAMFVNDIYNNPREITGLPLIIATYFFAFQIYCDFSGYSDIAIGSAQVMGFKLMDNFNRPYFSKSISEFWKRWHISLSTWFRDYLYIPLGGNKVATKIHWYFNLFFVFLVSGLWHGANWTFIVWGALHGFYLIFSIVSTKLRYKFSQKFLLHKNPRLNKLFKVFITFHLVLLSWIFFRANTLSDAIYIIFNTFKSVIKNFSFSLGFIKKIYWNWLGYWDGFAVDKKCDFIIAIIAILFMEFIHIIQRHSSIKHMLRDKPIWLRWSIYYAMILMIIFFGKFVKQQFIYFQF